MDLVLVTNVVLVGILLIGGAIGFAKGRGMERAPLRC